MANSKRERVFAWIYNKIEVWQKLAWVQGDHGVKTTDCKEIYWYKENDPSLETHKKNEITKYVWASQVSVSTLLQTRTG